MHPQSFRSFSHDSQSYTDYLKAHKNIHRLQTSMKQQQVRKENARHNYALSQVESHTFGGMPRMNQSYKINPSPFNSLQSNRIKIRKMIEQSDRTKGKIKMKSRNSSTQINHNNPKEEDECIELVSPCSTQILSTDPTEFQDDRTEISSLSLPLSDHLSRLYLPLSPPKQVIQYTPVNDHLYFATNSFQNAHHSNIFNSRSKTVRPVSAHLEPQYIFPFPNSNNTLNNRNERFQHTLDTTNKITRPKTSHPRVYQSKIQRPVSASHRPMTFFPHASQTREHFEHDNKQQQLQGYNVNINLSDEDNEIFVLHSVRNNPKKQNGHVNFNGNNSNEFEHDPGIVSDVPSIKSNYYNQFGYTDTEEDLKRDYSGVDEPYLSVNSESAVESVSPCCYYALPIQNTIRRPHSAQSRPISAHSTVQRAPFR